MIRKIFILFFILLGIVNAEYFTGEDGGECVNYARVITGNNFNTSPRIGAFYSDLGAYHIYDLWDYGYGRGSVPHKNSLMVLDKWGSNPYGHVGIVRNITKHDDGTYDLYVDESNWYTYEGKGDHRIIKNAHYFFDSNNMRVKREWNSKGYMHPVGEVNSPLGSSWYPVRGFVYTQPDGITRAEALKLIFDKFKITPVNTDFNSYIFREPIIPPQDVNSNTPYYAYIVTAYNRGIVEGNGDNFYPNRNVTLGEFIKMIVKTIPIPINNPNYEDYYYSNAIGKWYYPYVKAAYNAGILENKEYEFEKPIDKDIAEDILNKAYDYFLGKKSGISIYIRWTTKYADMDLYLFSPYDDYTGTQIEYDDNYNVVNMDELRQSNGIVYWDHHSTNWGANLDYDSWGGNGGQPWGGFGEERITVDSQMVRRPGKYSIIICYYDWGSSQNPNSASVDLWGIQGGRLLNNGGEKFHYTIKKGRCRYVATLNTR